MFTIIDFILLILTFVGYLCSGRLCWGSCPKYIGPMDIRSEHGVWIERLPGSRVAYDPFPGNFVIAAGDSVSIDFITSDPTGLIFLVGNFDTGDMVAVNMAHGYLTFIRKCGRGHVFERFTKRVDDAHWHKLRYTHSIRGGELEIDGWNPFQQYHLGPCSDFASVLFGGLTPKLEVNSLKGHDTHHRFKGCLRNMLIDGKIPMIHPKYVAVSACTDYEKLNL